MIDETHINTVQRFASANAQGIIGLFFCPAIAMDSRLKQRLIGAAVLIALAVIFLPMLVKGPAPDGGVSDLGLDVPTAPASSATIDLPLHVESAPVAALDEADGESSTQEQGVPVAAQPGVDDAAVTDPAGAGDMLPASVASGQYVVHYATFATQAEADQMLRQLQARELPAFTQPTTFNGRPAVSVRIGPYASRADAETIRVRAAQVRADIKPLVLALDADTAQTQTQTQTAAGTAAAATGATVVPPRSASAPLAVSARSTPAAAAADVSRRPATAVRAPPSNTTAHAATAAPTSATGFVVQIGAFSNAASATNLRNRLRAANIPTFTDTVNTSRGRLTRVNAGPVSSRAEADRLKAQVKSAVGSDGIVRSHP